MNKETKDLYIQEVKWRDQEIKRLNDTLFKANKHIVDQSTPTDYTSSYIVGALFMLISLIPAWSYGRNSWQQLLYMINNFIWSNKEWWY